MRTVVLTLWMLVGCTVLAQDITGRWITVNDETGKKRSVVEINVKNGVATGHVVHLFRGPNEDQDPICHICPDDRKGKKVMGMEIIRNMVREGNEWVDGTIMDPANGKVYDCKFWLENGVLKVRGYVAFFYRTQTWVREPK